ncbi:MAG: DMT family transporter, partial [Hamadaea sp.]|nr:DMT family transporter [Hamadaea sp.]
MAQRATTAGLGLALLSAATFGTSGTFARSLIDAGWSAEAAVAARVGIAALVLAVPTAFALRGKGHVLLRNLRAIGLFGILAVGGAQVCFFNAVQYVPIGVALLLEYLGIILVVFWMWAVHGQRPTRLTVGGAVAALAGLVLVLNLTSGDGISAVGVLWGLAAAVGLAAYFVLSARVDEQLPSVALAAGGMGLGSVVLLVLGGVGVLPLHATFGDVTFAGRVVSWIVPILGLSLIAAA